MSKIFIQIASYRDPELKKTIKDCIDNSKFPENLVFGICRQYHPEDGFDDLSEYENDDRFRILNILYNEVIKAAGLDQYVNITILVNNKSKELFKINKANELLKYRTGSNQSSGSPGSMTSSSFLFGVNISTFLTNCFSSI